MLRAPVGQRVEKTEQQVAEVERVLSQHIPPDELETIVSSTGVLSQGAPPSLIRIPVPTPP